MLVPLKLAAGIRDVGTKLQSKGRWVDCNFVRWVEGIIRPIGKWVRVTGEPVEGRVSGLFATRDNVQRDWVAVGTSQKCYMVDGSQLIDVTPTDFVPGRNATTDGGGYGAADYGMEEYGTPREAESGLSLEANSWFFDRWGEQIVATCLSDGRAFVWDPGGLTDPYDEELQVITNAPVDNRALIVTNERHLMLLAAGGDPRKVQWSAREDYTEWTPSATNLAGSFTLESNGALQSAVKVGDELLVMSEFDVFALRYVGAPYGYGRERVGVNNGTIGPHAAVATNDFAVWMSPDGFYTYRGQVEPLACDVWDFVFRDLNYGQRALVTAGHNSGFSEVWWFFPVVGETENNRYVVWNYRSNVWYVGQMKRTAWQDKGVLPLPIATGEDGYIYSHEHRFEDAALQPRSRPFIEAAPIELGDGEQTLAVTMLVPDRDTESVDALRFYFSNRFAPRLPVTTVGPFYPNDEGYTPVRFSGRQISLRVEADRDVDWRLGVLRAEVKRGGKR